MLGQRLGKDEIYRYMRAFGIGQRSAVNFPNEQAGNLMPPDKWWCSSQGTIPIGQGVSVTPLQMLVAYNAIANGGVYVAPRLVGATIDPDGTRHVAPVDQGHRVVSKATSDKMNLMLRGVVLEGTGKKASIEGYTVAGKTGTARKPLPGGGYGGANGMSYEATFVGFVPAEAPALSVIVIIDEPTKEGIFGGVVAAPAFAKLAESALRANAVPPPVTDGPAGGIPVDVASSDTSTAVARAADSTSGVTFTADGRVRAPPATDDPPPTVPALTPTGTVPIPGSPKNPTTTLPGQIVTTTTRPQSPTTTTSKKR
jgi:membrane peptidoglycan carboxypeptidase